ncbi:hypothetical protein Cyrtocomes_01008 [Candidatus Cyrtobacter comes]|uniref:Outer membrane protein beta-barrel domain-containing protein n=1 Tax=Candidatus Cyrtobacter comes TaxID=675776 RepID=A0ABU5L915_9RICK|nr:hypothetical protein [Candidatus Cyrtobacter comes]
MPNPYIKCKDSQDSEDDPCYILKTQVLEVFANKGNKSSDSVSAAPPLGILSGASAKSAPNNIEGSEPAASTNSTQFATPSNVQDANVAVYNNITVEAPAANINSAAKASEKCEKNNTQFWGIDLGNNAHSVCNSTNVDTSKSVIGTESVNDVDSSSADANIGGIDIKSSNPTIGQADHTKSGGKPLNDEAYYYAAFSGAAFPECHQKDGNAEHINSKAGISSGSSSKGSSSAEETKSGNAIKGPGKENGHVAKDNANISSPFEKFNPSATIKGQYKNVILGFGFSEKYKTISGSLSLLEENPIEVGFEYTHGADKSESFDIKLNRASVSVSSMFNINEKFMIGAKVNLGNSAISIDQHKENFFSFGSSIIFSYSMSENINFTFEAGFNKVHGDIILKDKQATINQAKNASVDFGVKFIF